MKRLLLLFLLLFPLQAFADWKACAQAYRFSPMLTYQGCVVQIQDVPDLDPSRAEGSLGFRYKRGKSKWCRIRAECPVLACDAPQIHQRGWYGARCTSYRITYVKTVASLKMHDADNARWCSKIRGDWYIAPTCQD